MKLLDKIMDKFGWTKKSPSSNTYAKFLDGSGYFYSQNGKNIYASDCVQVAIHTIATQMKLLIPIHYVSTKGEDQIQNDQIQKVLENPNPLMTTSDYIEKIVWNLFLNYNAFIYPLYKDGKLVSLTPLQPTNVEFSQDLSGKLFIKFTFANDYQSGEIPYENIIHIRYKYSVNDVMGGNEQGQPDNAPLLEVLNLNKDLITGLAKSLKMQTTIQAMVNLKSYVGNAEQLEAIEKFEQMIQSQESAILPIISSDLGTEFTPIQKQIQLLDQTTLDFIDKKIFRWFNVSVAIVNGDFSTEQFNAFIQKALDPLITSFEQAHTKGLFTNKETFGFGHKIKFELDALVHMSISERLTYINMLIDTGSAFKNEIRKLGGLKPVKELEGQIASSSNKQNAENNSTNAGGGTDEQ